MQFNFSIVLCKNLRNPNRKTINLMHHQIRQADHFFIKQKLREKQRTKLVLQEGKVQHNLMEAVDERTGEKNKLLMHFENSTFVKRLKAASRRQIDMAADLNTLDGFGVEANDLDNQPTRTKLAGREVA